MITLNDRQARNFAAALAGVRDRARRDRLAFAVWSESRGYNLANDGANESHSPGFTAATPAILRRSLDLPHDTVGSNGRSVGILQQTPAEVGGGWGDMAGCMTPAIAAERFLARLVVTNDPVYSGLLLQPDGTKKRVTVATPSPVVADVLRVQQPLASEAASDNYGPANLAVALEISARFAPATMSAAAWLRLFAAVAAGK